MARLNVDMKAKTRISEPDKLIPNPAKFRTIKRKVSLRDDQLSKKSSIDRIKNSHKQFLKYHDPRSGLTFKLESVVKESSIWIKLVYKFKSATMGERTKIIYIRIEEARRYGLKFEGQAKEGNREAEA